MKSADFNIRLINGYLELLKNLDPSSKLELIFRLKQTMKLEQEDKNKAFNKSFGAWDSSDSAEEITKDIRNSRSLNREVEEL